MSAIISWRSDEEMKESEQGWKKREIQTLLSVREPPSPVASALDTT
jgi:hypothetical protein